KKTAGESGGNWENPPPREGKRTARRSDSGSSQRGVWGSSSEERGSPSQGGHSPSGRRKRSRPSLSSAPPSPLGGCGSRSVGRTRSPSAIFAREDTASAGRIRR